MADFEVAGVRYRSRRMSAIMQFDMLQALSPILPSISELFGNEEAEGMAVIMPIANALAVMPREKTHFVIEECMRMVDRDNGKGGWARVWNDHTHGPNFEDVDDLSIMSQLVVHVLQENFLPFSQGVRLHS
jgi:hypothetical protein